LCRLQMVGRYAIEALHVRFVEDHGSCRVGDVHWPCILSAQAGGGRSAR
jgi:hypothetical protein